MSEITVELAEQAVESAEEGVDHALTRYNAYCRYSAERREKALAKRDLLDARNVLMDVSLKRRDEDSREANNPFRVPMCTHGVPSGAPCYLCMKRNEIEPEPECPMAETLGAIHQFKDSKGCSPECVHIVAYSNGKMFAHVGSENGEHFYTATGTLTDVMLEIREAADRWSADE